MARCDVTLCRQALLLALHHLTEGDTDISVMLISRTLHANFMLHGQFHLRGPKTGRNNGVKKEACMLHQH